MIYALAFMLSTIDGFIDFAPDTAAVADQSLPPVTDGQQIGHHDTLVQVQAANTSSCLDGSCRVQASALSSRESTCAQGNCPTPARRLRPLRNLFRRGR